MYKRNKQGWLKHIDFILWDVVALQLAFILAYNIRNGLFVLPYLAKTYSILAVLLIVLDILIAVLFDTMHKVMSRGMYSELVQTIKQVLLVLLTMLICMFVIQESNRLSRIIIFLTALFHMAIGYAIRMLWKKYVRAHGKTRTKGTMVLVADEKIVGNVLEILSPIDDFEITGVILTDRDGTGEIIADW